MKSLSSAKAGSASERVVKAKVDSLESFILSSIKLKLAAVTYSKEAQS
jgi:hypothetical protein